jgi:hypothetical protein
MLDNAREDMVVTRILVRYLNFGDNPLIHEGDGGRCHVATQLCDDWNLVLKF